LKQIFDVFFAGRPGLLQAGDFTAGVFILVDEGQIDFLRPSFKTRAEYFNHKTC